MYLVLRRTSILRSSLGASIALALVATSHTTESSTNTTRHTQVSYCPQQTLSNLFTAGAALRIRVIVTGIERAACIGAAALEAFLASVLVAAACCVWEMTLLRIDLTAFDHILWAAAGRLAHWMLFITAEILTLPPLASASASCPSEGDQGAASWADLHTGAQSPSSMASSAPSPHTQLE